jgi:hypothetical protein
VYVIPDSVKTGVGKTVTGENTNISILRIPQDFLNNGPENLLIID